MVAQEGLVDFQQTEVEAGDLVVVEKLETAHRSGKYLNLKNQVVIRQGPRYMPLAPHRPLETTKAKYAFFRLCCPIYKFEPPKFLIPFCSSAFPGIDTQIS